MDGLNCVKSMPLLFDPPPPVLAPPVAAAPVEVVVSELQAAAERLRELSGRTHKLHSAVVVAQGGAPIWREVKTARLTMRAFSDAWLEGYLARGGEALLSSVGAYQLEGEGVQLFSAVEGDYFTILGLPLFGLFDLLRRHGALGE